MKYIKNHYVPEFYQREFSSDKKGIYRLDLDKISKRFHRKNISKNLYRRNLYNKRFELLLGRIENIQAIIVRNLNKRWQIPEKEKKDILLQFITMQHCRISGYKDELSIKAEEALKQNITEYTELLDERQIEIHNKVLQEVFERSIQNAILYRWLGLKDLKIALISNKSNLDFIFSDHPVVFKNLKYNNPKGDSKGILRSGLTVFLPINPKKMIILYDKEIYHLKSKEKIVNLFKQEDIVHLNTLQLFNCYQYLYCSVEKSSDYMIKLFEVHKNKVEKTRKRISFLKSPGHYHKLDSYYNPKTLSFIEQSDVENDNPFRDRELHERMTSLSKIYKERSESEIYNIILQQIKEFQSVQQESKL